MKSNRDLVLEWFDRVWVKEDSEAICELYNPEAAPRSLGSRHVMDSAEYREFHRTVLGLIGSIQITIDHMITEGEWTCTAFSVRAKSRRDGKPVSSTGLCMVRIVNEQIVDGCHEVDFLGLFSQLNKLPSDAFLRALTPD